MVMARVMVFCADESLYYKKILWLCAICNGDFGCGKYSEHVSLLKVEYLIICIICDTDLVNKLILQVYTLHKYK